MEKKELKVGKDINRELKKYDIDKDAHYMIHTHGNYGKKTGKGEYGQHNRMDFIKAISKVSPEAVIDLYSCHGGAAANIPHNVENKNLRLPKDVTLIAHSNRKNSTRTAENEQRIVNKIKGLSQGKSDKQILAEQVISDPETVYVTRVTEKAAKKKTKPSEKTPKSKTRSTNDRSASERKTSNNENREARENNENRGDRENTKNSEVSAIRLRRSVRERRQKEASTVNRNVSSTETGSRNNNDRDGAGTRKSSRASGERTSTRTRTSTRVRASSVAERTGTRASSRASGERTSTRARASSVAERTGTGASSVAQGTSTKRRSGANAERTGSTSVSTRAEGRSSVRKRVSISRRRVARASDQIWSRSGNVAGTSERVRSTSQALRGNEANNENPASDTKVSKKKKPKTVRKFEVLKIHSPKTAEDFLQVDDFIEQNWNKVSQNKVLKGGDIGPIPLTDENREENRNQYLEKTFKLKMRRGSDKVPYAANSIQDNDQSYGDLEKFVKAVRDNISPILRGKSKKDQIAHDSLENIIDSQQERGQEDFVGKLLFSKSSSGDNLFMEAAKNGKSKTVDMLYQKAVEEGLANKLINEVTEGKSNVLMKVAERDNKQMMESVIDKVHDIGGQELVKKMLTKKDKKGETALMKAAKAGSHHSVTAILEKSKEILGDDFTKSKLMNSVNLSLKTPLMEAATRGNLKVAQALVSEGADIGFKSKNIPMTEKLGTMLTSVSKGEKMYIGKTAADFIKSGPQADRLNDLLGGGREREQSRPSILSNTAILQSRGSRFRGRAYQSLQDDDSIEQSSSFVQKYKDGKSKDDSPSKRR